MNDREEHIAGHEDSEYHFSDDDVSYEVEPEGQKPSAALSPAEQKPSILKRLTSSKRMMISLGVFLVLMFVVYRMISGPSTPPTEITPVPSTGQMTANAPSTGATAATATQTSTASPTTLQTPAMVPSAAAPNQMAANPAVPQQSVAPQSVTPPPTNAQQIPQQVPPSGNVQQMQQVPPANTQQIAQQVPQQPGSPPANLQQATQQLVAQQQQMMQPIAGMPNVIPVMNNQQGSALPGQAAAQQNAALIAAQNDRLMSQMQAEYQQRLNEYASQNKAMQDQMQVLSTRVAGMENQLNQIYQAVNQSKQSVSPSPSTTRVPPPPPPKAAVKIPYTVQAIIPGRAWLKSDSGDTVTVTEGDILKDVGRVTKIDPYDGIVEVNTGNTMVSLSYGSGG